MDRANTVLAVSVNRVYVVCSPTYAQALAIK
jgi:hypothetical protein